MSASTTAGSTGTQVYDRPTAGDGPRYLDRRWWRFMVGAHISKAIGGRHPDWQEEFP